ADRRPAPGSSPLGRRNDLRPAIAGWSILDRKNHEAWERGAKEHEHVGARDGKFSSDSAHDGHPRRRAPLASHQGSAPRARSLAAPRLAIAADRGPRIAP